MKVGTNIGELIANSSVGHGLANLRANPEDELAKLSEDLERLPREFGGNAPNERKPQPRTRRTPLLPLSAAEIASRRADAHARAAELERKQRASNPVTFEIVHRRR